MRSSTRNNSLEKGLFGLGIRIGIGKFEDGFGERKQGVERRKNGEEEGRREKSKGLGSG